MKQKQLEDQRCKSMKKCSKKGSKNDAKIMKNRSSGVQKSREIGTVGASKRQQKHESAKKSDPFYYGAPFLPILDEKLEPRWRPKP